MQHKYEHPLLFIVAFILVAVHVYIVRADDRDVVGAICSLVVRVANSLTVYAMRTPRSEHCVVNVLLVKFLLCRLLYKPAELWLYHILLLRLVVLVLRLVLVAMYARAYGL